VASIVPGDELTDPELDLQHTPDRAAKAMVELLGTYSIGALQDLDAQWKQFDSRWVREGTPVVQNGIRFYSMCAHHMLPFFGYFDVQYVVGPGRQIAGLSKLARTINYFSAMLQTQERLTTMVHDYLASKLSPTRLQVHTIARHLCMEMRGVHNDACTEVMIASGDGTDLDMFQTTLDRP